MTTYQLTHDDQPLATVQIDHAHPKAAEALREMVTFWCGAEDRLKRAKGDYTKAWLHQLARFLLRNARVPTDDEGWAPLDGSWGIKVTSFSPWEHDEGLTEVEVVGS